MIRLLNEDNQVAAILHFDTYPECGDIVAIDDKFYSADEVIEFLQENGHIAETTNNIEFKYLDKTYIICIEGNFDDVTYQQLRDALSMLTSPLALV